MRLFVEGLRAIPRNSSRFLREIANIRIVTFLCLWWIYRNYPRQIQAALFTRVLKRILPICNSNFRYNIAPVVKLLGWRAFQNINHRNDVILQYWKFQVSSIFGIILKRWCEFFFSWYLPQVIAMLLCRELMAHYKLLLLYIISGMHGSRLLYIITGMPVAYHKPIRLLILACLLGVA